MYKHLFLMLSLTLSTHVWGMESGTTSHQEPQEPQELLGGEIKSLVPTTPITTGFFDRTIQENGKSREAKLNEGEAYVTQRRDLYGLFLEQINSTYSHSAYQSNGDFSQKVSFLRTFFEGKLARLENKWIHFQAHLEEISPQSRKSYVFNFIGEYSGKLNGQAEAQAKYAYAKYQTYLFMDTFLRHYGVPKASSNAIIQTAIQGYIDNLVLKIKAAIPDTVKRKEISGMKSDNYGDVKRNDVLSHIKESAPIIDGVVKSFPLTSLESLIDDKYSLQAFSQEHLEKWQERMRDSQKDELTTSMFRLLLAAQKG